MTVIKHFDKWQTDSDIDTIGRMKRMAVTLRQIKKTTIVLHNKTASKDQKDTRGVEQGKEAIILTTVSISRATVEIAV